MNWTEKEHKLDPEMLVLPWFCCLHATWGWASHLTSVILSYITKIMNINFIVLYFYTFYNTLKVIVFTGFIFKLICIGVWLLYNAVLVSAGQQNESAVRIHSSPPFWTSFPFRSPQSIKQSSLCSAMFSLVIYFTDTLLILHITFTVFIHFAHPYKEVHFETLCGQV